MQRELEDAITRNEELETQNKIPGGQASINFKTAKLKPTEGSLAYQGPSYCGRYRA